MATASNIILLREKFIIRDARGADATGHPLLAMSNRMAIKLYNQAGDLVENFVVRTQNMHSCVHMASKIIASFEHMGPILKRPIPFEWAVAWDSITEEYERQYNPARWIAVYAEGKIVYAAGAHHIFLDLIEKCDANNKGRYDDSILLAEQAFIKTGKQVTIEYQSNVALSLTLKPQEARCAIILRGAAKTATFNFNAAVREKDKSISPADCLVVAASFLEGIQLSYIIGSINEKVKLGLLEEYSDDWRKAESARRRLGRLNAEIRSFENKLDVRYRPEKPEFGLIVDEAERNIREAVTARINAESEKVT